VKTGLGELAKAMRSCPTTPMLCGGGGSGQGVDAIVTEGSVIESPIQFGGGGGYGIQVPINDATAGAKAKPAGSCGTSTSFLNVFAAAVPRAAMVATASLTQLKNPPGKKVPAFCPCGTANAGLATNTWDWTLVCGKGVAGLYSPAKKKPVCGFCEGPAGCGTCDTVNTGGSPQCMAGSPKKVYKCVTTKPAKCAVLGPYCRCGTPHAGRPTTWNTFFVDCKATSYNDGPVANPPKCAFCDRSVACQPCDLNNGGIKNCNKGNAKSCTVAKPSVCTPLPGPSTRYCPCKSKFPGMATNTAAWKYQCQPEGGVYAPNKTKPTCGYCDTASGCGRCEVGKNKECLVGGGKVHGKCLNVATPPPAAKCKVFGPFCSCNTPAKAGVPCTWNNFFTVCGAKSYNEGPQSAAPKCGFCVAATKGDTMPGCMHCDMLAKASTQCQRGRGKCVAAKPGC
jgi:hypothetical protein